MKQEAKSMERIAETFPLGDEIKRFVEYQESLGNTYADNVSLSWLKAMVKRIYELEHSVCYNCGAEEKLGWPDLNG